MFGRKNYAPSIFELSSKLSILAGRNWNDCSVHLADGPQTDRLVFARPAARQNARSSAQMGEILLHF